MAGVTLSSLGQTEVRAIVAATEWDRTSTKVVQIRGPVRVWTAAQNLLREVQAEHAIEGRRVTPDWYLRSALAYECILSLRQVADQLPQLLDTYSAGAALARSSPAVKAATAAQALQAVAKAELVAEAMPQAVAALETLRVGHDSEPATEIGGLAERVQSRRSPILVLVAEALIELRPDQSKSDPDLFGEAVFTLMHYTEQAIASGDAGLVRRVFPKVLPATLILEDHVLATYKPPTYEFTPATLDPVVDLLELSGLALIYSVLRGDQSDHPVREAWMAYVTASAQPKEAAQRILAILDLADGGFSFGISPRSVARTEWEMRQHSGSWRRAMQSPTSIPWSSGHAGRRHP